MAVEEFVVNFIRPVLIEIIRIIPYLETLGQVVLAGFVTLILFIFSAGIVVKKAKVKIVIGSMLFGFLMFIIAVYIPDILNAIPYWSWGTREAQGADASGKKAYFDIYILSQEYSWKYKDHESVEFNGRKSNIKSHIRSILKRNTNLMGIICVGTSSVAGFNREEQGLSKTRAEQLDLWIRESVPSNSFQHIYTLDLGNYSNPSELYDPEKSGDVPEQRRVILIGIRSYQKGVDITSALNDALQKKINPPLPFDVDHYDNFTLNDVTLGEME